MLDKGNTNNTRWNVEQTTVKSVLKQKNNENELKEEKQNTVKEEIKTKYKQTKGEAKRQAE